MDPNSIEILPMTLSPALLLLPLVLTPELQVEGLREGEEARTLPPAAARPGEYELLTGRVVDARTGEPLPGARIEFWTEEVSPIGRGLRLVDETTSARDGQFALRSERGGLKAEKLRVRKEGYLCFAGTRADEELVQLVPASEEPLALRLVDLDGAPIVGATIATTYSCAHDNPAFRVLTDEEGIAYLPEYGRQYHEGELRVLASGYRAIEYLDLDDIIDPSGVATRMLPRQRTWSTRLFDREGKPMVGRAVHVIDGEGEHVLFPDATGRIELPAAYDAREDWIELLEEPGGAYFFGGPLPAGGAPALRLRADEFQEAGQDGPALGTVLLRCETDPGPITLLHPDGWADEVKLPEDENLLEVPFPAGDIQVLFGQAFEGIERRVLDLELTAETTATLVLRPTPEPTLRVLLPTDGLQELFVQAGEDSKLHELDGQENLALTVPAGRELTLWARGSTERLLRHPGTKEDLTIDLRDAEPRPRPPAAVMKQIEVLLLDASGSPLEGELDLLGPGEVEEIAAGRFQLTAPVGVPLLLGAWAEGHLDRNEPLELRQGMEEALELTLTPAASLELELPEGAALPGSIAQSLPHLNPGPLELVVLLSDGRRVLLDLELRAGEARRLRISL